MATAAGNVFAMDMEIAREAARRWDSEEKSRDRKVEARDRGELDKAESKVRIEKRIDYLRAKVRDVGGTGPAAASMESKLDAAETAVEEADSVTLERVIGETRDFLSIEFLEDGIHASGSVGRIVTELGGGRVLYGTGFLVAPGLLMTNWHVLKTADAAKRSRVEFNYQRDRLGRVLQAGEFELRPDIFFMNDRDLDFAIVGVAGGAQLTAFGYCPLIAQEGKILIGDPINIIQHPKGEMKQIVVRENRLLDLPDKQQLDRFAHYAADTEPGSSGSPVFNDQWDVIALHHSGVPATNKRGQVLDIDDNVWVEGRDDPDRIQWVGNEGIRVSRLMGFISKAAVQPHERPHRDRLVETSKNPTAPSEVRSNMADAETRRRRDESRSGPREVSTTANGGGKAMSAPGEGASVEVTIPITITVRVGTPGPARPAPAADDDGLGVEVVKPEPDYRNRKGFNPRFLGFSLPMPEPQNTIIRNVLTVDGGGHELKYHHYSVIMNKARRLAYVSAVNIKSGARFHHKREGGDKWYFDPRVGEEFQAGNEFYADNPMDRGHLTRRADAAWGETEEEARIANDDTFHWTNCAPQHEVYNQSTRAEQRGLLLWGTLENHIAAQVEGGIGKLSVFNGPIFRDRGSAKDRPHRGLPVPKEFWKVIAYRRDDRKPAAVAFILSQQSLIRNLPEEEFEVGPYKPFQVKIRDIEHKTKLDFGDLYKADPLERPGTEEAFESGTEVVGLDSLEDIIL